MIDRLGAEHSGIWAHGSNIGEIHVEGLVILLRNDVSWFLDVFIYDETFP